MNEQVERITTAYDAIELAERISAAQYRLAYRAESTAIHYYPQGDFAKSERLMFR